MPKITKRIVDVLPESPPDEVFIWDTEIRGFGIRVMPSGVASFIVKYRNAEGRQRKLTIGRAGTMTPDQARQIAREKLVEAGKGQDPSAQRRQLLKSITVSELSDRCLKHAKAHVKPTTWATNESHVRRHIKPLIGRHTVASLTTADVARMQSDIYAGKTAAKRHGRGGVTKGGKGVAGRTVSILQTMLEFAKANGLVQTNVAIAVKKVPTGQRTRFLTFEDMARLGAALQLEAAAGSPTGVAAVRFLLLSGCRKSEVLTLRESYLDQAAGCIRFPDTKSGAQARPLGASAFAALDDITPANGWVFPADRGEGHFVGVPRLLERAAERAELDGVSCHVLRHSFASAAAALGFSQAVIAGLLGHSLGGVTAIYTHLVDKTLVAAADQVSARIAAALAGAPASAA